MHAKNSRRLLLQAMATGLTRVPARWLPPVVAAVTLPTHAQTSVECDAGGQVVLGSCSGFTSCTGGITVVGESPAACDHALIG